MALPWRAPMYRLVRPRSIERLEAAGRFEKIAPSLMRQPTLRCVHEQTGAIYCHPPMSRNRQYRVFRRRQTSDPPSRPRNGEPVASANFTRRLSLWLARIRETKDDICKFPHRRRLRSGSLSANASHVIRISCNGMIRFSITRADHYQSPPKLARIPSTRH